MKASCFKNMNLIHLFEEQRKLDQHIEKEHPGKSDEDRFSKKKLALLVEIGELANELPEIFKFWSFKKNNYEKALFELVDCFHFILSLGLIVKYDYPSLDVTFPTFDNVTEDDLLEGFDSFFFFASRIDDGYRYDDLFNSFLNIASMIGFSWVQIEKTYFQKNQINHIRQVQGY